MIEFNKEGETPLDDISGLKIKGITTRSKLDEAEAENILEAFLKYTLSLEQLDSIKFDTLFLQQLHRDMFGNVWSWAGEFRTTQTSIGIKAINIRQALYQLMDDLAFWESSWDYKDTATKLHYSLVKIHPFLNGNGRCARLFTDLWLLSIGKNMLEWGDKDINMINSSRTEYILSLQEADNGNYEYLKNFMFAQTQQTSIK
jgi:Fic-DOC domain mobile mystery protein B